MHSLVYVTVGVGQMHSFGPTELRRFSFHWVRIPRAARDENASKTYKSMEDRPTGILLFLPEVSAPECQRDSRDCLVSVPQLIISGDKVTRVTSLKIVPGVRTACRWRYEVSQKN